MIQGELESQLSAMFDGELPAAECELLSRRIARDETLRSRWSRYALIGAAMRSEPVATARSGFALRVSAALEASGRPRRLRRGPQLLWNGALAATLVAGVAGLGVSLLRTAAIGSGGMPVAVVSAAPPAAAPLQVMSASYVTPAGTPGASTALRTQLADYIVAHSAYSSPLMRRNVLSELVTSEAQVGSASSFAGAAGGGDGFRSISEPSR